MLLFIIYIILLIYLIYFIWLIEPFFKKNIIVSKEKNYPFVSIIVSARNEEENINQLINSLLSQDYKKNFYEIIIANDKSTDSTLKKLNHFKENYSQLNIIDIKNTPDNWGSKKWALTQCIKKSKGEIILQTDADCMHTKDWLSSMVKPFINNHKIGFICGASYIGINSNFWDEMLRLESLSQESFTYANSKRNFYLSSTARNIAFRKNIFNEVEGYKGIEYIESGDDDLLLHKIATQTDAEIKFLANQKILVKSHAPKSIRSFYLQRLRYASKSILYYRLSTPIEVKIILPYLFIANLACIISILNFINYQNILWMMPLFIKGVADIILINQYMYKLNMNFKLFYFLILMILHPFYVVIIGGLAPIIKVQWK